MACLTLLHSIIVSSQRVSPWIVHQHRFMVRRQNLMHLLKLCIYLASPLELRAFAQHFYCLFRWACRVIIGPYLYESRRATLQDVAALFCVDAPLIHLSLNFTHEDPITHPSMRNKYVHSPSVICFLPLQNAHKWIWKAKWNECREGAERRLNTETSVMPHMLCLALKTVNSKTWKIHKSNHFLNENLANVLLQTLLLLFTHYYSIDILANWLGDRYSALH